MSWNLKNTWTAGESPVLADVFNDAADDDRTWGGDVDAGHYTLANLGAFRLYPQALPSSPTVGTIATDSTDGITKQYRGAVLGWVAFGGAKGDKGDTGDTGPAGPTGPQGPAGSSSGYTAPADYAFTCTPGGSLVVGANTITLSPFPAGIANGNSLRISGGTGAAETVAITSFNSTSVTVTCANTHSGAWTIASASGGIQEALVAVSAVQVGLMQSSAYTSYAPINVPSGHPGIIGLGPGAIISLAYNSGNGLNVVTGSVPTRLSNFIIAPASGNMTSGALVNNANSAADLYLDHVTLGLNGSRDAYIGVHSTSILRLRDVVIFAMYRGIEASNGIHFNDVGVLSDANLAGCIAGGAALYLSGQTGGFIDGFSHDAGIFDYGIRVDSASAAVNELAITNLYLDNWKTAGIKASGANAIMHWQLSNFRIQDNGGTTTGRGMDLGTAVKNWQIANGNIGFTAQGIVLNGSPTDISLTGASIFPTQSVTDNQAIGTVGGSTSTRISITGCQLGIGPDLGTTPSTYGIVIGDNNPHDWLITSNVIRGSSGAIAYFNGASLTGSLIANNKTT